MLLGVNKQDKDLPIAAQLVDLRIRKIFDPLQYWQLTRDFRATILNAETIVEYGGSKFTICSFYFWLGILGVACMILAFRDNSDLFFFARIECSTGFVLCSALIQIACQLVVDFVSTFVEEAFLDIPSASLKKIVYPYAIAFHIYLNCMWITWMIGELITWC